jgi:hypothetical protein
MGSAKFDVTLKGPWDNLIVFDEGRGCVMKSDVIYVLNLQKYNLSR